jgi:C4-dicarboxylate-specific signal transduction histidine kinase
VPYKAATELFTFPMALVNREGHLIATNAGWRDVFPFELGSVIFNSWSFELQVDPTLYWQQILADLGKAPQKKIRAQALGRQYYFFLNEGAGDAASLIWIRFERVEQNRQESDNMAQDERMTAMAEMAAGIAHEILNPLTIIAGKTSILQRLLPEIEDQKRSQDIQKCMDSITNQCSRITKIVRALRTFSRNGAQDALLPVPLRQLVDESIALCSEKSRLRGTHFRVDDPPPGAIVYCRAVQVVQILINLISNAIDATHEVDMPEVQIRFRAVPEGIEILVSDNGPGVPEQLEQKIFQPFYTTKEVGKGTGLGLSLSLRLSRDNGGDLFLDRSVGPSCFGLRLTTVNPMKAVS